MKRMPVGNCVMPLGQDVLDVAVDGAARNDQPVRDVLVGQSTGDELGDLALAAGQRRRTIAGFRRDALAMLVGSIDQRVVSGQRGGLRDLEQQLQPDGPFPTQFRLGERGEDGSPCSAKAMVPGTSFACVATAPRTNAASANPAASCSRS